MITEACLHQATESSLTKLMQLNFSASSIIQRGPSGVKVSAKTFLPLVPPKTEVEQ